LRILNRSPWLSPRSRHPTNGDSHDRQSNVGSGLNIFRPNKHRYRFALGSRLARFLPTPRPAFCR
jgi:hypothetical protein